MWWKLYIIIGLCFLLLLSIYITFKYVHGPTTQFSVYFVATIGFFFCSSTLCLLPLDILNYADSKETLLILWKIIYWMSQILNWIILPISMDYYKSGYFTSKEKLKSAIKMNIKFYVIILIIAVITIVSLAITKKLTESTLLNFVVILSQSFGLIITVIFLGYGIVAYPRSIYKRMDNDKIIKYHKFKLLKAYHKYEHTKLELMQVQKTFSKVCELAISQPDMIQYIKAIDRLFVTKYDLTNILENTQDDKIPKTINELDKEYWIRLHALVKKTNRKYVIAKGLFNHYMSYFDNTRKSFKLHRSLIYFLIFIVSIVGILLSICEGSLITIVDICPFIYFKGFVKFGFSIGLFILMCIMTCLPIFHLNVPNRYHIFIGYTDEISLLYLVGNILNIIWPLTYNFIMINGFENKTVFESIFGEIYVLQKISEWFPIIIIIVSVLTILNIPQKICNLLVCLHAEDENDEVSLNDYSEIDPKNIDTDILEADILIKRITTSVEPF
ncbi:MAG: LMBR1-domain-containing protein [Edafosvirus sp.]|uniref:LMBR1-domain-containing protein n=1 Tax=Edafosvirus sp. TaxID=2487765 RepID=A0A3G4ZUP7_9VIRU|nr:MAG: LMBR1-domain-containing protein [Edafosvirus sp.]